MKIDEGNRLAPALATAVQKNIHHRSSLENRESLKTANSDFSVELSRQLEQLSTVSTLEEDELRKAKVEDIRNQLASGNYNISGKDVADRMLDMLKS